MDEQLIYDQLTSKKNAVWSLLLASGYLKVVRKDFVEKTGQMRYHPAITNREIFLMFESMIHDWFTQSGDDYNDFVKALLANDVEAMNEYINQVAECTFSSFDTGVKPSKAEPEKEKIRRYGLRLRVRKC